MDQPVAGMPQCSPDRFARPGWLPAFAGLLIAALAAVLGFWQLDRAAQKRTLQARLDAGARQDVVHLAGLPANPEAWLYRRVALRGIYAAGHQVFIDNRLHEGRPGYHVLIPLQLDGPGEAILVNRGWLPVGPDRAVVPEVRVPARTVAVEGVLVRAQGRYLELSREATPGPVWQNLDLARYRASYSPALPDLMLLQAGADTDGLVRVWPRFDTGIDKHLGYAGQWFLLAALSLGLTLYRHVTRRRNHVARPA